MPEIGEIKKGRDIGDYGGGLYQWLACVNCGRTRWVSLYRIKRAEFTGRCRLCGLLSRKGEEHPSWKGGRLENGNGYFEVILRPDDFFFPMAHKSTGYVLEHRLIVARHLGRNLHPWEIVHHKGTKHPKGSRENRSDNRMENLQLVSDDRHKQITILENEIGFQSQRITVLEAEITLLRTQLEQETMKRRK